MKKKMPANLRKLFEWLDGACPLLETQIVAAGLSHTLDKALMRNFAEMNLREATLYCGPRTRCIKQIPVTCLPTCPRISDRRPLPLCPLTAAADLFNRRCRMVLGAPISGLAAGLAFDGLDIRPGDDKIALDHPHGERGHRCPFSRFALARRTVSSSAPHGDAAQLPDALRVIGHPHALFGLL